MSVYRICPDCGSSLDPGERCDCQSIEKAAPVFQHRSGRVNLINHTMFTSIIPKDQEEVKN